MTGPGERAAPRATQPHYTEEEPEVAGWGLASPGPSHPSAWQPAVEHTPLQGAQTV